MSLVNLRSKIDEIDDVLIDLLEKRCFIVEEIRTEKSKCAIAVEDTNRESFILDKIVNQVDKQVYVEAITSIYQVIFEESKKLQK